MNRKLEIPAIHDKDLRKLLESYGLAEIIDKGELKCSLCGNIITWDNIAAFKVNGQTLDVFCDDPECIENASNC